MDRGNTATQPRLQQVTLWVRVGGTPSPHIHTYIHTRNEAGLEAGPWFTQQPADPRSACPRAESPKFPLLLYFDFPPAKRVLSTRSSKVPNFTLQKTFFPERGAFIIHSENYQPSKKIYL